MGCLGELLLCHFCWRSLRSSESAGAPRESWRVGDAGCPAFWGRCHHHVTIKKLGVNKCPAAKKDRKSALSPAWKMRRRPTETGYQPKFGCDLKRSKIGQLGRKSLLPKLGYKTTLNPMFAIFLWFSMWNHHVHPSIVAWNLGSTTPVTPVPGTNRFGAVYRQLGVGVGLGQVAARILFWVATSTDCISLKIVNLAPVMRKNEGKYLKWFSPAQRIRQIKIMVIMVNKTGPVPGKHTCCFSHSFCPEIVIGSFPSTVHGLSESPVGNSRWSYWGKLW